MVSGRGIRRLRQEGLHVDVGCLQDRARRLNEAYSHWMRTGRPFVVMKAAMTLDGKIATAGGESQWITGEAARRDVHRLRSRVDAVMVGLGTVLCDDPQLTVRLSGRRLGAGSIRQPLRVVLDERLQIPFTAKVLSSDAKGRVLIATTKQAPQSRIDQLQARGVTVLVLPSEHGLVSLEACLAALGKRGVTSVLLEGGSELNASALRLGLVNRVRLYIAPLLLGGQDAKGLIGGVSPKHLADAIRLKEVRVRRIGPDLLVEGLIDTTSI